MPFKKTFLVVLLFSANFLCAGFDGKTWQKSLNDEMQLSDLTIPGSHNSATKNIAVKYGKCQSSSITEQLCSGIRVFDLRVNSKMRLCHGILSADMDVNQALSEIVKFLDENQTEFVILLLKDENSSLPEKEWTDKLLAILEKPEYKRFLIQDSPKKHSVKSLRGNALILFRFGIFRQPAWKLKWGNNAITFDEKTAIPRVNIQDVYKPADIYEKLETIKNFLMKSNEDLTDSSIWINYFTMAYRFLGKTPFESSSIINEKMLDYLKTTRQNRCGIVMLDFVKENQALVNHLIKINFSR